MLGWAVDGQPEIRDVPEPDLNRIASMNPDADMETAIANNYDVKYFEKKAGNLTSQYLIDSNQAQIQDAKDKAAKSLRNQYNAVLTGRDSLNAAVMALDVASVNLNTATAKSWNTRMCLTAIYPPRTVWRQISFSFCWPWKPMIGM